MMPFIAKHKIRLVFIAVLFVVFLVAGFIVFYNELRLRSKAAPTGSAILSLETVTNPPMGADGILKVAVKLDPNGSPKSLYAFDVQVKFDPSKMDLAASGGADINVVLSSDVLKVQTTLVGTDTIHIVGTKITNPFSSTNKDIGTIAFKMKPGSDFPAAFTWGDVTLETSNFVKIPLELATNTVPSSSSSSSSQNAGEVKLTFSSNLQQYHVGDTVNLDLLTSTGRNQIGSVSAAFIYDPSLLDYKSTASETSTFNESTVTILPPAGGNVILVRASRTSAIAGTLKIATIIFTAKAAGTVNFVYVQDKSAINTFGLNPQNILTVINPYSITISTISSSSSSSLSSIPSGVVEQSSGHILHINSNASYPSPFRYEQTMSLESGQYTLSGLARVYTQRKRGVVLVLTCGEADCNNGKKQNDIIISLPFALSTSYIRQEVGFTITNGPKKYTLHIYVEDGSEADFDYISIKNVWDGELVENSHFEKRTGKSFTRRYPDGWNFDSIGLIHGGLYNQTDPGGTGMLYINSSSRP